MMEGLQISIPQRMVLLRTVLIISLVSSILLSLPLWAGYRDYPLAPLILLDSIPAPYDYILLLLGLMAWISSLFLKRGRLLIFVGFLVSAYLVLNDLNRLQPWFYCYNMLLLMLVFYNGRVDDPNKYTSYFIILQIMLASVYFFCGLSQLNPLFCETEFLEVISPLQHMMSDRQFAFFTKMGFIVPYLLMFVGLGLIISPIRYLAITLGVCMHILLLVFLFPSYKNTNYALWWSNLCFMIMLILLFSGKTKQRYYSPTLLFKLPAFYPAIALFLVMPFFNINGRWSDPVSFNFKSGNTTSAVISLSNSAADKLPERLKRYCEPNYTFLKFNYKAWCLDDLHADAYPDAIAFNSICNYLRAVSGSDVKEIELQRVPKQKLLLKP